MYSDIIWISCLGIDICVLRASVRSGYPGSRFCTVQYIAVLVYRVTDSQSHE
jgi:hypothetical protein